MQGGCPFSPQAVHTLFSSAIRGSSKHVRAPLHSVPLQHSFPSLPHATHTLSVLKGLVLQVRSALLQAKSGQHSCPASPQSGALLSTQVLEGLSHEMFSPQQYFCQQHDFPTLPHPQKPAQQTPYAGASPTRLIKMYTLALQAGGLEAVAIYSNPPAHPHCSCSTKKAVAGCTTNDCTQLRWNALLCPDNNDGSLTDANSSCMWLCAFASLTCWIGNSRTYKCRQLSNNILQCGGQPSPRRR